MNSKTVTQLKNELISKKQALTQLQHSNNQQQTEEERDLKDLVDRSDAEEAWFNKERMNQHWKHELIQIDNALHRIESGTFGICEECESEIPVKRLRVRPDATLCLNCQEALEKELGPRRGPVTGTSIIRDSDPSHLIH